MSLSPLSFTGISTFSNDFQTILSRAVSIASIPLKTLQNQDADVLQKKTLLASLSGAAADLGASLTALGTLGANKSLSATSSNTGLVSVTNTGAAAPASYTINQITSVAKAASETSASGYADSSSAPVSSTGTVKLTVGSNDYTINLAAGQNNLVGLQNAINRLGIGITASIITTGTGLNPNLLSVSSNSTGATTLQLHDDPTGANTSLLTNTNQGANAVFQVNGANITRASNIVNDLVPGITLNILGATTGTPVTLTVAADPTQISSGLQDFVNKYNALATQVANQVGPHAGLLSGDFIVRQIEADLRSIASHQLSTGSVKSLSDLGVTFNATGQLSFSAATFSALSSANIADAVSFLGSTSSGFGGQQALFNQVSDPIAGLAKLQQTSYDVTDTRLQKQIGALTDRISQLQTSLSAKLQAADSLVASLQNQQSVLSASIQSLNLVLYGPNTSNPGTASH